MTLKPGRALKLLDPEDLSLIFTHPAQRSNLARVCELIERLRDCESAESFYEFQRLLFREVYSTEERRAQCSRVIKRFRAGKSVPNDVPPPMVGEADSAHAWQMEAFIFERIARQLRTVGDGLAWRVFGYDRRIIMTLSRNDSPGMMFGKDGLPYELGRVEDLWREKQHFALLHDLTNCLRIADVSEFTDDGVLLHEVKKNAARTDKRQLERIQASINAIMHGGPLPGASPNARLVELSTPVAADLRQLKDAIQLAKKYGSRGMRLNDGRALVATSPYDVAVKWAGDHENGQIWLSNIKSRAIKRAGISGARHHIRGLSSDLASRSAIMTPWSVYPFSAEDCAELVCDFIMFETIVAIEALVENLEAVGLQVEVLLPNSDGELGEGVDVLRATWRDRSLTVHSQGISQLLYELVHPRTWASGIKEALTNMSESGEPVLLFAEEARHWFGGKTSLFSSVSEI